MRRAEELSPREMCVHGSRHLPTRTYVTPLGRTLVCMDWQDRAPYKDENGKLRFRHHNVWYMRERKACRLCGNLSFLSDCRGRPCHKVCAEAEWVERQKEARPNPLGGTSEPHAPGHLQEPTGSTAYVSVTPGRC